MNYYAEAIEILFTYQDQMKLLYEISKKNPKAIVNAHKRIRENTISPGSNITGSQIHAEIVAMKRAGVNKINAIKKYREYTNCDLKTAKEYVDNIYHSGEVGAVSE